MKFQILIFISILIISFSSCKNTNSGTKNSINITEKHNRIIDSLTNIPKNINDKTKIKKHFTNQFIVSLKSLPIKELPISKNWKNFESLVFVTNLINQKKNTTNILNNKNLIFNKPEGLEMINEITKEYAENYYFLLFMESKQTQYFFLERLKPLSNKIEVFINYSKIITGLQENENGIILKLNILDTEKKVLLNSYFLMISGIAVNAENNNGFYEGFMIDNDYNIKVKSYTSVEGESIEMQRKIKIFHNGTFSDEKIDGKIETDEHDEIYIENFSKKIKH